MDIMLYFSPKKYTPEYISKMYRLDYNILKCILKLVVPERNGDTVAKIGGCFNPISYEFHPAPSSNQGVVSGGWRV